VTERSWDFSEGWFANPVFINGDFPEALKSFFGPFLPEFTDEEKQKINGTGDVFAHDGDTAEFYSGQYLLFLSNAHPSPVSPCL
jgi:hypothetical protein